MLARMLVLALVPACWTGSPPPATPPPPARMPPPCELGAGAPIDTPAATVLRVRSAAKTKVASVSMIASSPDGRVTTQASYGGLLSSGDIVVPPGTFTVEVTDDDGRRTLCKNVELAVGHRTTLRIHRFVCARGQEVCTPL